MTSPSIGRETRNMVVGRAVTLLLSLVGMVLYPKLLGPEAHGAFQYYHSLHLFLLGFLNGCAAPMAAHYVALYRAGQPARQGVLLRQVFRWYVVLLIPVLLVYPILRDTTGFGWIFFGVAASGLSQVIASAVYGLGRLGPITWFPVLTLFLKIVLICGIGAWVFRSRGLTAMETWGVHAIPGWLFVATVPPLIWMVSAYGLHRSEWFVPGESQQLLDQSSYYPWEEIRNFGLATVIGQIVYQVFTRTLTVVARQFGYPLDEVGYLGLATQAFGQVVFLAGIFSIGVYPWLVSAGKLGDQDRFKKLQTEAWRLCAAFGGYLVVAMCVLIRPTVWIFLGQEYREDIDLLVRMVWVCALAGALMLAGEFHLRMLISITSMKKYLLALLIGFPLSLPYLIWVLAQGRGILALTWVLPLGVGCMTLLALYFSPKTENFHRVNLLTLLGMGLSSAAAYPFAHLTLANFLTQGLVLSVVYVLWCWLVRLIGPEDLARLTHAKRPAPPEARLE